MNMRILFITSNYPPQIGGPSRQSKEIVDGLRSRGHGVILLVLGNRKIVSYRDSSIPDEVLNFPKSRVAFAIGLWQTVTKTILNNNIDVVHFQVFGGWACVLCGFASFRCSTASLVKFTGERSSEVFYDILSSGSGFINQLRARTLRLFHRMLEKLTVKIYSGIWATTPTYEVRLQNLRASPEKVFQLPNFIDLAPFSAAKKVWQSKDSEKSFLVLTLTRLRPFKGLEIAIRAAAELPDEINWQVHGEGSSEYRKRLEELVASSRISHRFKLLQPVDPTEVYQLYRTADLFVLLSDDEPFGIVFIEAMAAGVPVVGTKAGGVPDVFGPTLEKQLVPVQNAPAAAAVIRSLLFSPEERARAREAGIMRARDFDVSVGLNGLEAIYAKLRKRQNFVSR